ncbi:MAG: hypothetical protein IPK60_12780 [Sandaracinaceae bacterium]|jgi:hypothetical protein|nr:hypothetical protein [Sandaracinaceae bacterium]
MADVVSDEKRLEEAERAFQRGNYKEMKRLTSSLAQSEAQTIRDKAGVLAQRTAIDPVQLRVVLACLLFFLVVAYKYVF